MVDHCLDPIAPAWDRRASLAVAELAVAAGVWRVWAERLDRISDGGLVDPLVAACHEVCLRRYLPLGDAQVSKKAIRGHKKNGHRLGDPFFEKSDLAPELD